MADVLYDAILGGTTVRQILDGGFNANAQIIAGRASGAIDPSELYGAQAAPNAPFETSDLAGLLGGVSVTSGLSISAGTITLPFQKRANQAEFQGSLSHPAIDATDGLVIIESISSRQGEGGGGLVTARGQVIFISTDGATDPVSGSTGNSLASQSFSAQFDHGPAVVNSSEVAECVGWTANTGISVRLKFYQGLPYPTAVFITRRRPTIDVTFEDLDDAMGFLGSFTALTGFDVYGRKYSDGASHVAEGTAQHLKVSFADGIIDANVIQASGDSEGQATVRGHGLTLTASTASAIP